MLERMATAHNAPRAHENEPHKEGLEQRLNWLRAGVLGANDGIVSTAAVIVGVAGATSETAPVFLAGSAALVGGAISMALGEYVSVSSQRDTEKSLIAKERAELSADPAAEFEELIGLYEQQGLSTPTATQVARELTDRDPLRAHLSAELHIDPDDVVSPWRAAIASAISFTTGALLPMLTMMLTPHPWRILFTVIAVLIALAITGYTAAKIGGADRGKAMVRTVIGGALALGATYLVGTLFGTGMG